MQFWSGTPFMPTRAALEIAQLLDEAGFDGVICADHMIYPKELRSRYPSESGKPGWAPDTAWPDSWVMIGAMAALTTNLRFSNAVYVAPSRPLLEVAKMVATAAEVSEGRVSLGVGVGWMREEYELMGQDFATRGKRLDEMIPALRALWQGGWVSWSGEYYGCPNSCSSRTRRHRYRSCAAVSPRWRCAGPPGCATAGSAPPMSLEEAVRYVDRLRELRREYGRADEPFEVLLALLDRPSVELYQRAEEAGITAVLCAPWAVAEDQRGATLRFAEKIISRFR